MMSPVTGRRVEGRSQPKGVPARLRPYWYRLFRVDDQRALAGFICALGAAIFGLVRCVIHPQWQAGALVAGGLVAAAAFFVLPTVLDVLLERPPRARRRRKSAD